MFDCLQVNQIWWLRKWGQIVAFKMSGMKNCVLIKQLNIYRKADLIFGIKKKSGMNNFTASVFRWNQFISRQESYCSRHEVGDDRNPRRVMRKMAKEMDI